MWKQLPRDLKILLFSMVIANIGGRIALPFLPLYILELGGDVADVGLYFTVSVVSTALMRPFGGWVSDSLGRLQAVGIGTIFGLSAFIGFTLAPSWEWLLGLAVIQSVGRALVGPSFQAYTAESAPQGQTARTFGLVNGTFSGVNLVGPLLGGWMATQRGLRAIFWLGLVFVAVATVLRLVVALRQAFVWQQVQLVKFKLGVRNMASALAGGGFLTWLFLDDIAADFGYQLYDNLVTVYLDENGLIESEIGFLFFIFAAVHILASLVGGRLADHWNPAITLAIGGGIEALALLALVNISSPQWFFVYFVVRGLGLGIAEPSFDSLLAKAAPQGQMGLTFGLFQSTVNIFSTPAPYIGSYLWATYEPNMPFVAGAVVLFLEAAYALFVLLPYFKKHFADFPEVNPAQT